MHESHHRQWKIFVYEINHMWIYAARGHSTDHLILDRD